MKTKVKKGDTLKVLATGATIKVKRIFVVRHDDKDNAQEPMGIIPANVPAPLATVFFWSDNLELFEHCEVS